MLKKIGAELFIPDGVAERDALARTTHLAIAAHQDDLEIMAHDGILKCFRNDENWFTGVVVTNGSGSPRTGLYADFSDDQMQQVRRTEQKKAAFIGEYAAQVLMNFASAEVKDPKNTEVIADIKAIITAAKPRIIYTHNPADKHETHVATALKALRAIRELPEADRPERLYGCEVWRDLDWLPDDAKVYFDLSAHENIGMALLGVFDSQICGGKRYDLAVAGRRRSNATFAASHGLDATTAMGYAMDLTPLIRDVDLDIKEYVRGFIMRFARDVEGKIEASL